VAVQEIGEAMQGNHRLACSSTTLDDQDPFIRTHKVILVRLDGGNNRLQALPA
jgi:hypothetical protein